MKYVRITVDGVTYNLVETSEGTWKITTRAPLSAGDYLMTVVLTAENGREIILDTTDEELLKAITLLVVDGVTEGGYRMLDYYPEVIKQILEFKALMLSEGFEIDFLKTDVNLIVNEGYLLTMSERRIAEWENLLKLAPTSDETIEDRRDKIIAAIRGKGKLNTKTINSIVGSFTNGGTAISYIEDSTLFVKVQPPNNNKQYKFSNVEKALISLIPAHLSLSVIRDYANWKDIKDNFLTWQSLKELNAWEDLLYYRAP